MKLQDVLEQHSLTKDKAIRSRPKFRGPDYNEDEEFDQKEPESQQCHGIWFHDPKSKTKLGQPRKLHSQTRPRSDMLNALLGD